jgi:hypothetical protein
LRNEKGIGGLSPNCLSKYLKSTVLSSIRGGVPVLSRLKRNPASSSTLAKAIEGASPLLPAGKLSRPLQRLDIGVEQYNCLTPLTSQ